MTRMVLALTLICAAVASHAQTDPVPVRLLPVSGNDQTIAVDTVAEAPFVLRAVHADTGEPLSQLPVHLFVNYRICLPMDPNCSNPPQDLYGTFVGTGGSLELVTDDNGEATGSAFRAGSLAGDYQVAAMLSADANPGFIAPPPDGIALFHIRQVAGTGAARPVSGPRPLFIALLVLAIGLVARRSRF